MSRIHARAATAALILAGALASAGPAAAKSAPSTVKCGDTLTHSVKLTADLTDCPDKGLVIGADGITVDLNGHTIDGTVTQITDCDAPPFGPAGITNSRYDRVTIENGTLQQFFAGFGAGTETTGMSNSTLRNLTARDNRFSGISMGSRDGHNDDNRIVHNHLYGNGCGNGIGLNTSARNLIAHNRSHDNGGGIAICCSQANVVRDNVVAHNAENGITVCCDSRDNVIEHNHIIDNAGNGVLVFFTSEGTSVRENQVARNGDNIVIEDSNSNTISRNRITDALGCPFCDGPTGYGIVIVAGADDNEVSHNVINGTREDGIRILDFDSADPANPAPNRTLLDRNVVGHASGDGVRVDSGSTGTLLRHNRVFAAGDDGIQIDSASASLTRNWALFNHDLGIETVPGVTDGGGNRAHGNGNPAQCSGITCD